jgi:hypothetical protein
VAALGRAVMGSSVAARLDDGSLRGGRQGGVQGDKAVMLWREVKSADRYRGGVQSAQAAACGARGWPSPVETIQRRGGVLWAIGFLKSGVCVRGSHARFSYPHPILIRIPR